MPNKDAKSAVNFQSKTGDVAFQPEQPAPGEENPGRLAEAAQNVNWNKVGIGVGAAAAVAGAAYAAKKYGGRGSDDGGSGSSGSGGKKS